jgi:hypothetical protein
LTLSSSSNQVYQPEGLQLLSLGEAKRDQNLSRQTKVPKMTRTKMVLKNGFQGRSKKTARNKMSWLGLQMLPSGFLDKHREILQAALWKEMDLKDVQSELLPAVEPVHAVETAGCYEEEP